MSCRISAVFCCVSFFLFFSCNDNDPVSPDSESDKSGIRGTIEGYVTLDGDSISGVEIRTSSSTLAKANRSENNASSAASGKRGYYRLELESGTHELVFLHYFPSSNEYGNHISAVRTVEVFPESVIQLNVEMTDSESATDLYARALANNGVRLEWNTYDAHGYDVYRSVDKKSWIRLTPLGENTYSSLTPRLYDTVPEFGTYYYRMEFKDLETDEIEQSDTAEVEVTAAPFDLDNVYFEDSLFFVYCRAYLPLSEDSSREVEVFRSEGRAENFRPLLTAEPKRTTRSGYFDEPGSSYMRRYVEFRDSVKAGVYFYRFLVKNTETGTVSDTSKTYSVNFRGPAIPPTMQAHDSIAYVHVEMYTRRLNAENVKAVVYRSIGDTTNFKLLDTVRVDRNRNSHGSYYDGIYAEYPDLEAPHDTLYYRAHWIFNDNIIGDNSAPELVVYNGLLNPPSILGVEDSGKTIGITLRARYSYAPVILYRIEDRDTTAIDTFHCSGSNSYSRYECELSDNPGREGYYSYAVAHLSLDGIVGEMSECMGIYTTNRTAAPSLSYSIGSVLVELSIGRVKGASMYILKRYRNNSEVPELVDTIPPNSGYYERATEYTDTLLEPGYYNYSVSALDFEGEMSEPANESFYFTPRLSSPPSFYVEERGVGRVRLNISESSSSADSIVIERSSLAEPGFREIGTMRAPSYYSYSNYFYDTLTLSGIYSYRIKGRLGKLESAYSEPKTIEITLPLPAPTGLSLDSLQNGIMVSWQEVPEADGYFLYRETHYYYGITRIADISTPTTSYLDTNQTKTDVYEYMVSAYKNGVESQKSPKTAMHYTVD